MTYCFQSEEPCNEIREREKLLNEFRGSIEDTYKGVCSASTKGASIPDA